MQCADKKFLKSVNIWQRYGHKFGGTFLWFVVYTAGFELTVRLSELWRLQRSQTHDSA